MNKLDKYLLAAEALSEKRDIKVPYLAEFERAFNYSLKEVYRDNNSFCVKIYNKFIENLVKTTNYDCNKDKEYNKNLTRYILTAESKLLKKICRTIYYRALEIDDPRNCIPEIYPTVDLL